MRAWAQGADIYRCFVLPTALPNDVHVSAIEYRPGNRAIVHHVLCYVDTSGRARELDNAEPGSGYTCFSGPMIDPHGDLGGWAPGNEASFLPEGIGRPRALWRVHWTGLRGAGVSNHGRGSAGAAAPSVMLHCNNARKDPEEPGPARGKGGAR